MAPRYLAFLERRSLTVGTGQIQWYTTQLNRHFVHAGRQHPRLLTAWFNVGTAVGVLSMFGAVGVLAFTVVTHFTLPTEEQVLTAVVRMHGRGSKTDRRGALRQHIWLWYR